MSERKSYLESCKLLQSHDLLEAAETPPLPERMPCYDDEVFGVSFFRTQLADISLENLTLPRTFFGRSEIRNVSFRGSDLSESSANWNDFISVDFSSADLSRTDLRASIFERVNFKGAVLQDADLRRVTFRNCVFTNADFTRTKLQRSMTWLFRLTRWQRSAVDWQISAGPEPEGG